MRIFIEMFVRNERGATAIEYGLLAALLSVSAIAVLQALGVSLQTMFNTVANAINAAVTSAG